jgi:hypothetical protein
MLTDVYSENQNSETTNEELRRVWESIKERERGNAGWVVLAEYSQWLPFVDMVVDTWVSCKVENIWIT